MTDHTRQGAAPSGTLPAVTFSDDGPCLAAALRAVCFQLRTLPEKAAFATLAPAEPLWQLAAALAGVTLLGPEEPLDDGRRVVGVLADAAGWPERTALVDAAMTAARLRVPLVIDAPSALVDPDALAVLAERDDVLVAVTSGEAPWSPWTSRLVGAASLLRHARWLAAGQIESIPA